MSDNLMSRRKFLVSAGTVAAAAAIAGIGLAKVARTCRSGRRHPSAVALSDRSGTTARP